MKNIFTLLLCLLLTLSLSAQIQLTTTPSDLSMLTPGQTVTLQYSVNVVQVGSAPASACVLPMSITLDDGGSGVVTNVNSTRGQEGGCEGVTPNAASCGATASSIGAGTTFTTTFVVGNNVANNQDITLGLTFLAADGSCGQESRAIQATVLPIALESMTGQQEGELVTLDWTTEWELNNDYFTIERSFDGVDFEAIGTVYGSGTTEEAVDYQFVDRTALQTAAGNVAYYRLVQTDFDGTTAVANTISVELRAKKGFDITMVAQGGASLDVHYSAPVAGKVTATLFDLTGRPVAETATVANEGFNALSFAKNGLRAGMYVVALTNGNHRVVQKVHVF